jgi:hypothetical protein
MVPLDPDRVRMFAAAKGSSDVDAFLAQIEVANLWRFARRPLDLDWLVAFWRNHRRLGSLAEMLENSLTARVRETNPDRASGDGLDETQVLRAIERIGAALVFARKTTIAIPDGELVLSDKEQSLDLAQVLPDWSSKDRSRLLTRPVFDPATFGRVRLHNDNEGVVRGYLTARWLFRLRQTNLSRTSLFDLLFATTYGLELVKPSMQETAAWLSIWDEEVAREVIQRDPSLLLTAGDPTSLSTNVRQAALTNVVERLAAGDERSRLMEFDSVKRFAQSDLSDVIRTLWSKYCAQAEVRPLLLRLIWLGQIRNCADIAEAALATYTDRSTRIVAGRALAKVGDETAKQRYVEFLKNNCEAKPNAIVWDAIDGLFPRSLNVHDLLGILSKIDITDDDGALGFEWQSPGLVDRLDARPDLETFLNGLMAQLGPDPGGIGHIPNKREMAYFSGIAATACRLIGQCGADEAPAEVIDAALELGARGRNGNNLGRMRDIPAELHRTARRRRLAFWRAAERLRRNQMMQGRPIEHPWHMDIVGYSPNLQLEDITWLLEDGPRRTSENERRLATNAAMWLWHQNERQPDLLSRIERKAQSDLVMQDAYNIWLNPPPQSSQILAQEREIEEIKRRAEEKSAARNQSWLEFIGGLRKDPNQLRGLRPTAESVDTRLYHLWRLLTQTADARTCHAIDSVAPLEEMLGAELTAALRDGLIQHWRLWRPRLKSSRGANEKNQINEIDCMGIAGVSLEARTDSRWVEKLTTDEAVLAASYGTLYLGAAFAIDSAAATDALVARVDMLQTPAQTALVEQILPNLFGTGFPLTNDPPDLTFASLERLVCTAFRTIRVEEDHDRPSGQVYSPDERDNAERARGAAVTQLAGTPGRSTFDALYRLTENRDCPIPRARLRKWASERAVQDSESAPWLPAETVAFERTAETAPSTAKDLQRVALRRLDDMQHELLHADFAQGETVAALPNENAVQNWVADRLRLMQGRSYSVERESHVVNDKEPDVRLRAEASDACVAIEIKVPESKHWTLETLEAALTDQLCGQYLRAREARHGILLLVHQRSRPKGWRDRNIGQFLTFSEVVSRLRTLASQISGAEPDSPQPEIAVLDVSQLPTRAILGTIN